MGGWYDGLGFARRRQDIAWIHPKRSLAISSCPAAVGGHGGRWVISVSSIAEGHKSLQPIPSAHARAQADTRTLDTSSRDVRPPRRGARQRLPVRALTFWPASP